jgi:hypothetical protein
MGKMIKTQNPLKYWKNNKYREMLQTCNKIVI